MLTGTEILTTAQMRAIESDAMASGAVTGLDLMERAGTAVAGQIRLRWPKPGRVTVLCGPGNNGGDGYVIARHLHQAGWRVRVLGMDNTPGPDAAEMKRQWAGIGPILPLTEGELRRRGESSDVYVDAIFGTGLTRPPAGEIASLLAYLGGSGGDWGYFRDRLVAVDCPSGLCMDSGTMLGAARSGDDFMPHARLTVAFDSPKIGHMLGLGPLVCGDLVIADIGLAHWRRTGLSVTGDGRQIEVPRAIGQDAIWPLTAPEGHRLPHLLSKAGMGHKFSHGHALIVAGGVGHGGAARLAARAALRIGAGLVTICPPKSALIDHAGPPDALMRQPVDDAEALTQRLSDRRITAVCLGPGAGTDRAAALLSPLLASRRACVLDADALTALSREPNLFGALHRDCVLTPHAGEFARLFPDLAGRLAEAPRSGPAYSKLDAARAAAARCGAIILLKGSDTVIAAPDGFARIHSAFDIPWLATAGAGDVLAGLIAGLLARRFHGVAAASAGVLVHAKAARRFGPGLIADDLPDQIPALLKQSAG